MSRLPRRGSIAGAELRGEHKVRPYFVNGFGIKNFLTHNLPIALFLMLAIEATVVPIVAGRAHLLDFDQQHIRIAISPNALDVLNVPARFTLEPLLIAAAAEEMRLASLNRLLQSCSPEFIHAIISTS